MATPDIELQASELLSASDPPLKEFRDLWRKLRAPEDRPLVQKLLTECHKRTLAKLVKLEREPETRLAELKDLVEFLKAFFEFKRARTLLDKARVQGVTDPDLVRWIGQQLALCTYKDEELPPEKRFHEALEILDGLNLRESSCNIPETLGLGGAVYKRRWDYSGQIEHLRTALYFYRKGWEVAPAKDMGYCGVNAAYILDLLAKCARAEAAREKTRQQIADQYLADAHALREKMKKDLPEFAENWTGEKEGYWYKATMAEVHWGLEDWGEASKWLASAAAADHDEWARQTTAKQLVSIAAMRGILPPAEGAQETQWHEAWRGLKELLGEDTVAALTCHRGKVGLALSGGGFRASLFHLGVLARLAECDVLRSVEVLSTVSGGSIIGAHYYLELRHLLQTRTDVELRRSDYVEVVRRVMDDFLAGVQMNLRTRALANLFANVRMILPGDYTRSNRMGELYEKHLYARIKDDHWFPINRRLRDILIRPLLKPTPSGEEPQRDEGFKPKFSNWRRKSKVPILLLNTTSLNSGHNWHFTASWMGEPPGLLGEQVDMNERYRRLYYHEAPTEVLRDYPVGYAVAASSCVPVLFEPLVLKGLYPGRTIQLVDGGVHDNQGVAGLLDESCNFILCSDASGQMDDQASPANGMLSVFYRSDSILQDRLREAQYQDLRSRADTHALQGLFFIHLKQELETAPISWVDCRDEPPEHARSTRTSYGVDREIQRLLSEIRTDLDTFTEVEAYALMASGYLMTKRKLEVLHEEHQESDMGGTWGGFKVNAPTWTRDDGTYYWPFVPLEQILAKSPQSSDCRRHDLAEQLRASRFLFGKAWLLCPPLRTTLLGLGLAIIAAAVAWLAHNWDVPLTKTIYVREAVVAVALLIAGTLWPMVKLINLPSSARSVMVKIGLATVGWLATTVHLWIFDPIFRRRGALRRLLALPDN